MTLRLVGREEPSEDGTVVDEYAAAARIAEMLEREAASMPIHSPLRALALRSGRQWRVLAATRPIRGKGKP